MPKTIHIAAALLLDTEGRSLLVRKRGSAIFMQPGGKIDPGESPLQALVRELEEELCLRIDPAHARPLGQFRGPAANEPGFEVCCELFEVRTEQAVQPAAEIEEARWVSSPEGLEVAPLSRDQIFPRFMPAGPR